MAATKAFGWKCPKSQPQSFEINNRKNEYFNEMFHAEREREGGVLPLFLNRLLTNISMKVQVCMKHLFI